MSNYTIFNHPNNAETINFYTPNDFCEWRIDGLLTKEPITIEWINNFKPTDVFWDIGANIGVYTMYAAKYQKCQVHSFEPVLFNIGVLAETVKINNLKNITLYPVAINNRTGISEIAVYNTDNGYGGHTVDKNNGNMNQGVYSITIDELILQGIPVPNHIKIDVDGIEPLIINGAKNTLPKIDTLLVEVDLRDYTHIEMIKTIEDLGFKYDKDQVEKAMRPINSKNYGYAEHLFYKI